MLVQIEGTDNAGKTTMARKVVETLKEKKIDAALMQFPRRDTKIGNLIDEMLKFSKFKWNDAVVFQLLQTANRMEFYEYLKEWHDNKYGVLVLDRYSLSSIVYGKLDGFPYDLLIDLQLLLPIPQVTIIVTADRKSLERRLKEKEEHEIYENMARMLNIQETYLKVIEDLKAVVAKKLNLQIKYFVVDNSDNQFEKAHDNIIQIFLDNLNT